MQSDLVTGSAIAAFKDRVDTHFDQLGQEAELRVDLIDGFDDLASVKAIIAELLEDPEALEKSAAQSRSHENGFDKILLTSSSRFGWRLRLDIWWPETVGYTENIHNHRWDFVSHMLIGSYRADYFKFDDAGKPFNHYTHTANPTGVDYGIKFAGVCGLIEAGSHVTLAGETTPLKHSELHRITRVAEELTATLFLRSNIRQATTSILADYDVFAETYIRPERFTVEVLRERLIRFLESC